MAARTNKPPVIVVTKHPELWSDLTGDSVVDAIVSARAYAIAEQVDKEMMDCLAAGE